MSRRAPCSSRAGRSPRSAPGTMDPCPPRGPAGCPGMEQQQTVPRCPGGVPAAPSLPCGILGGGSGRELGSWELAGVVSARFEQSLAKPSPRLILIRLLRGAGDATPAARPGGGCASEGCISQPTSLPASDPASQAVTRPFPRVSAAWRGFNTSSRVPCKDPFAPEHPQPAGTRGVIHTPGKAPRGRDGGHSGSLPSESCSSELRAMDSCAGCRYRRNW